jgi:hypothetical protein
VPTAQAEPTKQKLTEMAEKFDIVRDMQIIAAGGMFCRACLTAKPLTHGSPDPRYCQACYDYLMAEASNPNSVYWHGEVCFHDGGAWGTDLVEIAATPDGRRQWDTKPICLGAEAEILAILKGQAPIPEGMDLRRKGVLRGILERSTDERTDTIKPNSAHKLRAIKTPYKRVRPVAGIKHRAIGFKRVKV